jgi:hypothetical protein
VSRSTRAWPAPTYDKASIYTTLAHAGLFWPYAWGNPQDQAGGSYPDAARRRPPAGDAGWTRNRARTAALATVGKTQIRALRDPTAARMSDVRRGTAERVRAPEAVAAWACRQAAPGMTRRQLRIPGGDGLRTLPPCFRPKSRDLARADTGRKSDGSSPARDTAERPGTAAVPPIAALGLALFAYGVL